MTQKTKENPWTMDVRVRERNLKSGALTDKELEKQLAALPDLADQAEPFATSQPALAQPQHVVVAEPSSVDDDLDDEDDEEEDEEEVVQAQPQEAPVEPEASPAVVESVSNGEGELP